MVEVGRTTVGGATAAESVIGWHTVAERGELMEAFVGAGISQLSYAPIYFSSHYSFFSTKYNFYSTISISTIFYFL